MNKYLWVCAVGAVMYLGFGSVVVNAQYDPRDNPFNYNNSSQNPENSSYSYDNSPYNQMNNPYNQDSNRIIRDSEGNATGYAVPRARGGVNYFDLDGTRRGYSR